MAGNRTPVEVLAEALAEQDGKGRQFRSGKLTWNSSYVTLTNDYIRRATAIQKRLNDNGIELVEIIG